MKKVLLAILIFSFLTRESWAINFELFKVQKPSKLANFVCDAVSDAMNVEIGVKRVTIVKHHSTLERNFVDDIGKCLASDFSVLTMDLNRNYSSVSMQKPSMVVLLTEELKQVSENLIFSFPRSPF